MFDDSSGANYSSIYPGLQNPPAFFDLTGLSLPIDAPQTMDQIISLHQDLTQQLMSSSPRKSLLDTGNFQTCYRLAEHLISELDMIPPLRQGEFTLGDPTCGTGVFLLAAVVAVQGAVVNRTSHKSDFQLSLVGIDRDSPSLSVAWFCLTMSLQLIDLDVELELVCADLLDTPQIEHSLWDLIVGNPPWITWTDLPSIDKNRWKRFDDKTNYNLVTAQGMDRTLGAVNIDIGPLLFLLALDRYAAPKAQFAFLFKANLLNSSSLQFYRSGQVPSPSARPISLQLLFHYPVSSNFIGLGIATDCYLGQMDIAPSATLQSRQFDPSYQSKGNQILYPVAVDSTTLYLSSVQHPLRSDDTPAPEIRHGIKHDCKQVYEIDQATAEAIEWQCVFPTIKSRHIDKFKGWTGEYDLVIIPNRSLKNIDETRFSSQYPLVYDYLLQHRSLLNARKSRWVKQAAFYSVFGIGEYSFSTFKVAWVRLGWKPRFVLIHPITLPNGNTRPVVPSDHFLFIPTENREYAQELVDLLNSEPYQQLLEQLSSKKKSSLPKKVVSRLAIPEDTRA